ncbi:hypothetical protein [Hymenobacter psychrotolerans]|uniref:Uncharacterized protein n=1 Tax=Hymenobacter psychrotolerans DSM 18569 TaxID=1121959 RepID=A0A1M6Z8F4_9BACT|nr:hypothetical protein [Hymenobacter psychrotolerans]SHL26619.1 hypothetical protein SAMN02746009_02452 [Hymenobacter psychrotolerans DSM 18569]
MNAEISTWLASEQDYETGVALYEQHGASGLIKRLLAASCTSYSREVLARELGKLVAGTPAPPSHTHPPQAPAATTPDVVQQLRDARRPLLSEREYLHARLELLTEAERGEAALRILDLGDKLQESYAAEAYYAQHGTLPEPPPVAAPEPALEQLTTRPDIQYRLKLLRTQRSKLQDRPDRAADLAQVLANIDLLESKLSQ